MFGWIIFLFALAMIVVFLCEFTVWTSLFLILSLLFFRGSYDICQENSFPLISQVPLWLSLAFVFFIFMPPLVSQKMTPRKKFMLLLGILALSTLCLITLLTLTLTDVLCPSYIQSITKVILIGSISMMILTPCLIYKQRKLINRDYKQVIDGLADAEERQPPQYPKQKRRVRRQRNYIPPHTSLDHNGIIS